MKKTLVIVLLFCVSIVDCSLNERNSLDANTDKVFHEVKNYIAYQKWWYPQSSMIEVITSDKDEFLIDLYQLENAENTYGIKFIEYDYFLVVDLNNERPVSIGELNNDQYKYRGEFILKEIPSKPTYTYSDSEKEVYGKILHRLQDDIDELASDEDQWSSAKIYFLDFELMDSMVMLYIYLANGDIYNRKYALEMQDENLQIFPLFAYDYIDPLQISDAERDFLVRMQADSLSILDYKKGDRIKEIELRTE